MVDVNPGTLPLEDEIGGEAQLRHFAAQMEAIFLADLAHSREITKEAWKRRGINSGIKEMAASIWQRSLKAVRSSGS
jgi:hypothetical protein